VTERLPDTRLVDDDVYTLGFMLRSPYRCPVEFSKKVVKEEASL
jgi:hypothetical protein